MDQFIREVKAWFALHKVKREWSNTLQMAYDKFDHSKVGEQLAYEELATRIDEEYARKKQEVLKCYGLSSDQNLDEQGSEIF